MHLMKIEVSSPRPVTPKDAAWTSASTDGPVLHVLVVDDDRDSADLMSRLLEMHGHQTAVVHTGLEVLGVARDFLPDVVLLDIGLPDTSGYEVARALRQEALFRNSLLVAVTGWARESDKSAAVSAGFDLHVSKPVDFSGLLEVLARLAQAVPDDRVRRPFVVKHA
jgi:CheY-like chemotaxis protein